MKPQKKNKIRVASPSETLFDNIPRQSEHMETSVFIAAVGAGAYVDDDGYGYWATKKLMSNQVVCPSDIAIRGVIPPKWATYVVWFNR